MDVTKFPERSTPISFMLEEGVPDRTSKKIEIGTGQWPMPLGADGKALQF
jgi:hypothetical protein